MTDIIADLDDYAVYVAAIVAGLGAIGWLVRKTHHHLSRVSTLLSRVESAVALAEHELRPNGGSSLYDRIGRIAGGVDALWESVDGLSERFETHVATQGEANRAMWPAIEAITNAAPHNDD